MQTTAQFKQVLQKDYVHFVADINGEVEDQL